jgi:hypothetical protein
MKVKWNLNYTPPSMYWDIETEMMVKNEDTGEQPYYEEFDIDKEYFVLGIDYFTHTEPSKSNFRLMGEIRCPIERPLLYYLSPYLYEAEMFTITDDGIPEDWVIRVSLSETFHPVRFFGIFTYSDLVQYAEENKISCYLDSHLIRQYDWDHFFDLRQETHSRIGPYLEQVYQEQLAWNQAPNP